ncbi:Arp2/3-interacting proteins Arpin [Pelomyxa schiedti]|nr:Arp2/3-interacting proteins Arpin [Pelomyxa schiedti]
MIWQAEPHSGAPSTTSAWSSSPSSTPFTEAALCSGRGLVVEGVLVSCRVHVLTVPSSPSSSSTSTSTTASSSGGLRSSSSSSASASGSGGLPTRFFAVQLKVTRACRRRFDEGTGQEIMPQDKRVTVVRTGYLTANRTVVDTPDEVDPAALNSVIRTFPGAPPEAQRSKLHPNVPNTYEFWVDSAKYVNSDFVKGKSFRLKTRGDSLLVETITVMDDLTNTLKDFAGDTSLGDSFASKIAKAKAAEKPAEPEDDDADWS